MGNFWKALKNRSQGAKVNLELTQAAAKGDAETVRTLLEQGADVDARSGYETALMLAASGGHAETVRVLLKRGANINPSVLFDWDSFISAVLGGDPEIVRLFLKQGADANARDPEHEITALMCATENGSLEIVHLLLDHGAEINAYDWMGRTAFMLAEEYPEIRELLRARGAKEEPPENG